VARRMITPPVRDLPIVAEAEAQAQGKRSHTEKPGRAGLFSVLASLQTQPFPAHVTGQRYLARPSEGRRAAKPG